MTPSSPVGSGSGQGSGSGSGLGSGQGSGSGSSTVSGSGSCTGQSSSDMFSKHCAAPSTMRPTPTNAIPAPTRPRLPLQEDSISQPPELAWLLSTHSSVLSAVLSGHRGSSLVPGSEAGSVSISGLSFGSGLASGSGHGSSTRSGCSGGSCGGMISACAGLVVPTSHSGCTVRSVFDCSVHSQQWHPAPCSDEVSVCISVSAAGSGAGHASGGVGVGERGVGCGGLEVAWCASGLESGSGMGLDSGGHSTWAGSVDCGGEHSSFGIGLVGAGVSGHFSTGAGQASSVGFAGFGDSSGNGRSQTHSQRDSNSL